MSKLNITKRAREIADTVLKVVELVLRRTNIKSNKVDDTIVETNKEGVSIYLPDHYEFIDEGRRPGKRPPVRAIIEWIREDRIIIPAGMKINQFAFLVARSIGRRGVKPRPFVESLADEIAEIVADNIIDELYKQK
jgi:hypothetical protein